MQFFIKSLIDVSLLVSNCNTKLDNQGRNFEKQNQTLDLRKFRPCSCICDRFLFYLQGPPFQLLQI
jgi:hypothetical protein